MDPSPLMKAHDHARAASLAHTDTTVAINEHALAAGEFSNASKTTTSTEALRTLKLLEQHHRKLSELLKFPLGQRASSSGSDTAALESHVAGAGAPATEATALGAADASSASDGAGAAGSPRSRAHPAGASSPHQLRYPPSRELSSSIASNLASARGIRHSKARGQPLAPSVSNDQAPGSLDGPAHKDGSRSKMQSMLDQKEKGKPTWLPPSQAGQRGEFKETPESKPELPGGEPANSNDESYSRFYSAFGGLINRLSAPLAFAGLPLIAEEPSATTLTATVSSPEASTSRKQQQHHHPHQQQRGASAVSKSQLSNPDPDLGKIYSKATLRALGRDGAGHSANDSFYFVPTTGGTVSYANILSFDQKQKRRIAASVHGEAADIDLLDDVADEDDFVDARESQSSFSSGLKRRVGKTQTPKDLQNAVEELYTENKGLKDMLDKLTKRLQAFEANAQNSHLALQSSLRLMRPGSPQSLSGSGGRRDGGGGEPDALRRRNRDLEDEVAKAVAQIEALEKECGRLQKTVMQYRDRWEKLKAGAKARRGAQGSGADNTGEPATPA